MLMDDNTSKTRNKPKRSSGWIMFLKSTQQTHADEVKNVRQPGALTQIAGKLWQSMSAKEKQVIMH